MIASGAAPPRSLLRLALSLASSLVVASAAATSPIIPRGGFTVTYYDEADPTCDVEDDSGVGTVGTTEGSLGLRADGSGSAEISCDVTASDDGFAVSGRIRYGGQDLTIEIPELKKGATLDAPSTGHLELQSNETGDVQRRDDCVFYFVGAQLVDEGKVWASYQCPAIADGDEGTCFIEQGTFAWEHCAKPAPDDGC